MPYDPIGKKAYDKERNAKLKQDYINANPSYIPTRTQDKKRVEERKNRYLNATIKQNEMPDMYNPFNEILNKTQPKPTRVQIPNGIEKERRITEPIIPQTPKFMFV